MVCNNCNQKSFESFAKVKCFFTKEPLSVVKCKNCDLIFLNPRPDKNLGLQYFENAYSNTKEFKSHSYYRDHKSIFLRNEKRFDLIKKLDSPNNKILDFGAGQGHFVKTAIDNHWQAVGLELSQAAIKAASENFSIELLDSIGKLKINDFGVIALWDVIEHLEDPKGTLTELSRFLHPEGYFIIETSNIDSLDFHVHKNNWAYWHVDHLYYYSKHTLEYLLSTLKFKLVNSPQEKSGSQSGKLNVVTKYFSLLNPLNLIVALKRKWISIQNKGIAKKSLMTIIAKRV